MDINQSIDPSQINDPVLRALVTQAQQVQNQSGDSNSENTIHPATHLIAAAMRQKLQGSSPSLTRVPIQNGPNFIGRFGAAMLGHPVSPNDLSVVATNQAPDQLGLPAAMQISPIGTDAQGNLLYSQADVEKQRQQAGSAFMMDQKMNLSNPMLTTADQIKTASGNRLSDGDAQQLLQAFGGSVPSKVLGQNLTGQRLDSMDALAGARQAMVTQSAIKTLMQYGGPGAAQKAASDASQRLVNLQRAQALMDQINANGGTADQRQRTELATALGRSLNPTGVLTNEALNMYLPESAKSKFGNFLEFLTNERQPVNFTGFMPALQDLLHRESDVNTSVFNQSRQMGVSALNQLPGIGKQIVNNVVNSPIPGQTPVQPQPQQSNEPNPQDYTAETNYLKQIGARLTPGNLKWARSRIGKK